MSTPSWSRIRPRLGFDPSAAARPTRTATYDLNEMERDDSNTKDKRFTKRNDGIIKVDEPDVTGVFVPFLLVDGPPGTFF